MGMKTIVPVKITIEGYVEVVGKGLQAVTDAMNTALSVESQIDAAVENAGLTDKGYTVTAIEPEMIRRRFPDEPAPAKLAAE